MRILDSNRSPTLWFEVQHLILCIVDRLIRYLHSAIGFKLIEEMNRIGMLVDLSHTSDLTATQAILHSKAPVIWSHSSAREIHDVARNVPDEVLGLIGFGKGQKDGIVMVSSTCLPHC